MERVQEFSTLESIMLMIQKTQNIFKKEQLEQPQKQPLANGFINLIPTNKKKNQKYTYFPPDSSNQKQQEKYQVEKSREKRSTSDINTFSRQSPIEQGKIYHPQQTQAQSRPISQNKKINFKAAYTYTYTYTYFPKSEQHQLPNSDKICVPHNRNYQINGFNELQKSTSPIQSHTSRQQDNKQSLNSINQGHSQTERCNYQEDNEYLLAKTTIPPNMSIQDQLTKCNTNSSIKLKRQIQQNQQLEKQQQQYYNDQIEQNKEYHSRLASEIIQCYFCDISQDSDFNFLPCMHQFHYACLKWLIDQQVNHNEAVIKCKCTKSIPQQIYMKYIINEQLEIFMKNQLNSLTKKNPKFQWKNCSNQKCHFLFIEDRSLRIQNTQKCPYCQHQTL